jgi:hypothetical protein
MRSHLNSYVLFCLILDSYTYSFFKRIIFCLFKSKRSGRIGLERGRRPTGTSIKFRDVGARISQH